MNKQIDNKAIEEMARILSQADENSYAHCARTKSCKECKYNIGKFPCTQNCRAEALYNAGYRKVNDDEWEKFYSLEEADYWKSRVEEIGDVASKETAREILQEVRKVCEEQADRFSHLCKTKKEVMEETCRYEGVLAVKNRLGKVAEKYGVEVK